ncbi:MAG TPA: hydrogenase maturation protease [Streptosporangiaceae bacterium]|nr:hydrogenase maturation protease [Streptosporangiaceae bacterium]
MTERGSAVLIGIGNSYRRDDGIGQAVVGAISEIGPAGVSLIASDGEPTALIEAWTGVEHVVLVDAVSGSQAASAGETGPGGEAVPGRIHRRVLVPTDLARAASWPLPAAASSHRMGVADALWLASAMDRLPRRLVAFGVEAADTGFGPGLSPAIAAALPGLVQAVLAELAVS